MKSLITKKALRAGQTSPGERLILGYAKRHFTGFQWGKPINHAYHISNKLKLLDLKRVFCANQQQDKKGLELETLPQRHKLFSSCGNA
ncbi:MAG: hypothetical protein V4634_07055 [Pseudomonadota bacterium]